MNLFETSRNPAMSEGSIESRVLPPERRSRLGWPAASDLGETSGRSRRLLRGTPASPRGGSSLVDTSRGRLLDCIWSPSLRRPLRAALALAGIPLAVASGCRIAPDGEASGLDAPSPPGRSSTETAPAPSEPSRTRGSHAIDRAEQFQRLDWNREDDIRLLVEGLEDPEPLVRGISVVSLMNVPPERVLALLEDSADGAASDERRLLEIETLRRADVDPPRAYEGALCRWSQSLSTPEIRARAASGCFERGGATAAMVDSLASDPEWSVRARLALALSRSSSDPLAAATLRLLHEDPHPTVRRAARARPNAAPPTSAARESTMTGRSP